MITRLLVLAAAGALGTLTRFGLCATAQRAFGAGFPWGTLIVNAAGCLLAGLVWSVAEAHLPPVVHVRTVILVGFMGGFTTFSAFMLETGQMLVAARWLPAMGNLMLQNVAGIGCLFGGMLLGKVL